MKNISIQVPKGYKAEWINNVLTLVEDKSTKYKFKVGDIVIFLDDNNKYKIIEHHTFNKVPAYIIKNYQKQRCVLEEEIKLAAQDITKSKIEYKFKIGDKVVAKEDKTIYTVVYQCVNNGELCYNIYDGQCTYCVKEKFLKPYIPQDITERIKTFEDAYQWCKENGNVFLCSQYERISEMPLISSDLLAYLKLCIITCALNEGWEPTENCKRYVPILLDYEIDSVSIMLNYGDSSTKLCFKSRILAEYAGKQFSDIYADFCGVKKGGDQ